MKLKYILSTFCLLISMSAMGVTDKEMQQAEAITAKEYLRWANDGSGYLDELHPSNLSELESKLRTKEKENLKAFRQSINAGDYSSWDKEQLIAYWSGTFFQSPKLSEKGKGAKSRVRSKLQAMEISTAVTTGLQSEKSTETSPAEAESDAAPTTTRPTTEELAAEQARIQAQADSIDLARAELEAQKAENPKEEGNYTYLYIIILCALVALVLFLVVYAQKVMAGNDKRQLNCKDPAPTPVGNSDQTALIASLQRRYDALVNENRRLTDELTDSNRRINELNGKIIKLTAAQSSESSSSQSKQKSSDTPEENNGNIIYLGRVNKDGLFIRADRNPAPGYTIFLLRTDDGYTGSFRVVNNPEVWGLCLNDPHRYLMGGAEGEDLDNTEGFSRVVNRGAGTAIFENGTWKVLRKARVIYS